MQVPSTPVLENSRPRLLLWLHRPCNENATERATISEAQEVAHEALGRILLSVTRICRLAFSQAISGAHTGIFLSSRSAAGLSDRIVLKRPSINTCLEQRSEKNGEAFSIHFAIPFTNF